MPNPGPYVNYMKPYVDAVWAKYATEDLIFDSGDAGVWQGRVQGEQLIMTAVTGGFQGRQAIITRRPTTQEVFEGKGVLDMDVQDGTTDKLVQAQICAALNRHVIDISTPMSDNRTGPTIRNTTSSRRATIMPSSGISRGSA